jgi:membrane-bound lytic murein transglycosylase MltF
MRAEGDIGWAIRKNSAKLSEALFDAYENVVKKQGGAASRQAAYLKRIKQVSSNTEKEEIQRFERTIAFFEKYGTKYGFDPVMLAAQGFQESQLRQEARSHVGAVGIMQIMPATGKGLNVGNIHEVEPNTTPAPSTWTSS